MLQAMIDIGSNTVRMAIYRITDTAAVMILKKKHPLGLAAYVEDGVMQEQGIDKVCEILGEFNTFLRCFDIKDVVAFTTAALRNAANSREAVSAITERTGIPIRVISGDEEAVFDFIGATHGAGAQDGLLVDIGGGSTELVSFKHGEILRKISLPVGSLSLASSFVGGILPTAAETAAMRAHIKALFDAEPFFEGLRHEHISGIGGTLKSTSELYRRLYQSDEAAPLLVSQFKEIINRYSGNVPEADLALIFLAAPDRLHTLFPGMIIAEAVAERLGSRTLLYSDSGVREGYLYAEILPRVRK